MRVVQANHIDLPHGSWAAGKGIKENIRAFVLSSAGIVVGQWCRCKVISFIEIMISSKLPYLARIIARRGTRVTHGSGGRLSLGDNNFMLFVAFLILCSKSFPVVVWGRKTGILDELVALNCEWEDKNICSRCSPLE